MVNDKMTDDRSGNPRRGERKTFVICRLLSVIAEEPKASPEALTR
jgi:hypothetical protein